MIKGLLILLSNAMRVFVLLFAFAITFSFYWLMRSVSRELSSAKMNGELAIQSGNVVKWSKLYHGNR